MSISRIGSSATQAPRASVSGSGSAASQSQFSRDLQFLQNSMQPKKSGST